MPVLSFVLTISEVLAIRRKSVMKRIIILLCCLSIMLLTSCARKGQPAAEMEKEIPDTSSGYTYSYDSNRFIDDITIPDGMKIGAGKKFIKTWRVENDGTTTWKNYKLVFVRGDHLSDKNSVSAPHTQPGENADLTVPMKAPKEAGVYTSYWTVKNDKGETFGVTMWAQITVK